MVVTKHQGGGLWNCGVVADQPLERYRVQVTNRGEGGYLMIGFHTLPIQPNGDNTTGGYYLWVRNGNLYSAAGGNITYRGCRIAEGSIVESVYHRSSGTISFIVDGVDRGIAFKKVPGHQVLYPAVDLGEVNTRVTLL